MTAMHTVLLVVKLKVAISVITHLKLLVLGISQHRIRLNSHAWKKAQSGPCVVIEPSPDLLMGQLTVACMQAHNC